MLLLKLHIVFIFMLAINMLFKTFFYDYITYGLCYSYLSMN